MLGELTVLIRDLEVWHREMDERKEASSLPVVLQELQFSAYAAATGSYRQAFVSLRASLEILVGTVYFSVNRMQLAEWQRGDVDIRWSEVNNESTGVFSARVAEAFAPFLVDKSLGFRRQATTTYRRISEVIHGDPETWKMSEAIEFRNDTFERWGEAVREVASLMIFTLTVRFFAELPSKRRRRLAPQLEERFGHISSLMEQLGSTQ